MLTSKEAIWAETENSCPPVPLPIPEWGNKEVLLRFVTAAEAEEISGMAKKQVPNLAGIIAVRVLSDERGGRLFTNGDAQAVAVKLKNKVLRRIVAESLAMNALEDDEEEQTAAQIEAELAGEAENPTAE